MKPLKIVALIVGEPQAPDLWTLKALTSVPGTVTVVRATRGHGVGRWKRLKRLVHEHGLQATISRVIAGSLFGRMHDRRDTRRLDRLFDAASLMAWWQASGIAVVSVPHLNHDEARLAIANLAPDVIVRVSGGILRRKIFGQARIAALNIHHGMAPRIRGMWSIPWGIIENRYDWIGATLHEIDDGVDTGRVIWRGAPQIAPGDTATTLFFRAHLGAVSALARVLELYARGEMPEYADPAEEVSVYRSAPGVVAWCRFLRLREGRLASVTLDAAVRK